MEKTNLISYVQGLHKNMRLTVSQAVETKELRRRGLGCGTSKRGKTIHREMERSNVW